MIILVLVWLNRSTFDEDMRKNDFYICVPCELDLWPVYQKFVLLVTLVPRYVSTKLKVYTAILFRENQRQVMDGWTDRRIGCNTQCGPCGGLDSSMIISRGWGRTAAHIILSASLSSVSRGVDPGGRGPAPNILRKGPCINRASPIIKLQHILPCQSLS